MVLRVARTIPQVFKRPRGLSATSILAVALTGVTGATLAPPAQAQFFFDYGSYNRPYVVKKPKAKRSRPVEAGYDHASIERGNKTPEQVAARKPDGPLVITISLRRQRVSVWDRAGLMMEAPISSGKLGTPTPTGVFSILQKNRIHYSNLYDSAPMPNMQRLTWSGVALHAGVLPGYPASHGCIRLPHGFSKRLFEVTRLGTRVIVTYDPVQPVEFSHPQLFAAYPESTSSSTHALMPGETKVADASGTTLGAQPTEIGSAIGVATAMASEAPAASDAIASLRAERQAELARLAAAIPAAQEEKAAAVAAAAETIKSLEGRKLAVRDARVEANRAAADARKADLAARSANEKLASFSKSLVRKTAFTPDDLAKATDDEDRLETAALDLADAAEAANDARSQALAALAEAETALAAADRLRVEAVKKVRDADAKVAAAIEANGAAQRREAKRKEPVHVFISRKTQKVYVRQGYEPILEAPVTIERPEEPLGTHVFTALAVDPSKAGVSWSVASVPTQAANKAGAARKDRAAAMLEVAELSKQQTASAALKRLSLAADVRLKIEDVMKAGSSLIISDHGLSNETGKYTDFIVPVR